MIIMYIRINVIMFWRIESYTDTGNRRPAPFKSNVYEIINVHEIINIQIKKDAIRDYS